MITSCLDIFMITRVVASRVAWLETSLPLGKFDRLRLGKIV